MAKIKLTLDEIYQAIGEYVKNHYDVRPTRVELTSVLGNLREAEVEYELKKK